MRARRGYSLVEMMVVIVLFGVVASLTASALLTMFRADRLLQEDSAAGHAVAQIEMALRDDIHAADQADIDDNRLLLTHPSSERVIYTSLPAAVTRERVRMEQAGEQVVARDQFRLPRGQELKWQTSEKEGLRWVSIELQAHTAKSSDKSETAKVQRDAHFEIHVGRQRWSAEETAP